MFLKSELITQTFSQSYSKNHNLACILKFDKRTYLSHEKNNPYKLKLYIPKSKKIEEIKTTDLFIQDAELDIKFKTKIFCDGNGVSITLDDKYTKIIENELSEECDLISTFNYDGGLFYVIYDEDDDIYLVNEVRLSFQKLFDFVHNEMEKYDFSENDVKLVTLLLNDFIHPSFYEKIVYDVGYFPQENLIPVLFTDGIKNISKEKLFLLQSEFVNNIIENRKDDEIIDIFSELSFSEFKKCFCKKFRANSHTIYFLLHKISSVYFSKISSNFIKKISKHKNKDFQIKKLVTDMMELL